MGSFRADWGIARQGRGRRQEQSCKSGKELHCVSKHGSKHVLIKQYPRQKLPIPGTVIIPEGADIQGKFA